MTIKKYSKFMLPLFIAIMFILSACVNADADAGENQKSSSNESSVESVEIDNEAEEEEIDSEMEEAESTDSQSDDEAEKSEADNKNEGESAQKSAADLDTLKVHFIDVGQADAALLQYSDADEHYNILIDSGDWNDNSAINYLNNIGVSHFDLIVGSHPHADHIGQFDNVINNFDVDEVWMSGDETTSQLFERVVDAIANNDVGYDEPRAGDQYEIGPLKIDILSPDSINGELNNDSIVMKLTYGNVTFLFTGDAETPAESGMLSRSESLKADILKVGHHGSDTSSSESFVKAVDPEIAIMSVGEDNKYGHPNKSVVDRYKRLGITLYATKDNGTIVVETDGKDYDVKTKKDGTVTPESTGSGKSTSTSKKSTKKKDDTKKQTSAGTCVDINTASKEELQNIIHIGDKRVDYLIQHRPYKSVDSLIAIKGIGKSRIADIKNQNLACVE